MIPFPMELLSVPFPDYMYLSANCSLDQPLPSQHPWSLSLQVRKKIASMRAEPSLRLNEVFKHNTYPIMFPYNEEIPFCDPLPHPPLNHS